MENNPLGLALVAACGLLLLVSAALAFVWSRPASSGAATVVDPRVFDSGPQKVAGDIGPVSDYRVVTERPVFDESRQPAVSIEDEDLDEEAMFAEVADAPEVNLRGVVITPEEKLVTLKPVSNAESLIVREGEPLEGEYFGWTVADIKPRSVMLESLNGESLELDLQVNTRKIEEPPPIEPSVAEQAEAVAAGEDGKPLSRAEEIRQRIADRREELRRQAEENQDSSERKRSSPSDYQSAIDNLINRNRREDKEDEEKNGDGNDG